MRALILLAVITMITPTILAKTYKAPKLRLNKSIPSYKIKKVREYREFQELNYKVNTRPVRQRNIASKKRGGRLPSSQTQSFHANHVEMWHWSSKVKYKK